MIKKYPFLFTMGLILTLEVLFFGNPWLLVVTYLGSLLIYKLPLEKLYLHLIKEKDITIKDGGQFYGIYTFNRNGVGYTVYARKNESKKIDIYLFMTGKEKKGRDYIKYTTNSFFLKKETLIEKLEQIHFSS